MNSREHLADDLDRLVKRSRWVGYFAWAVALIVMIYGTPIVYTFLTDHDVPASVAWLLSLAADAALIVGLIATPILAELEEPAGWVGTLRWVAGIITWALQTAGSWTADGGPDMVGVWSHSAGPVLLFFAVEAASSFQRKVAAALTEKARQLENAEQRDADRRAHLAELEADLRAVRAELVSITLERDQHAETAQKFTAELDDLIQKTTAETTDLRAEIAALKAAKETVHDGCNARLRSVQDEHAETVRALRRELRQARTETGQSTSAETTPGAEKTRSAVVKTTDEDYLRAIRAAHPDWSSRTVSLGQIKTAIGINSQSTATRLRDALYPNGRPDQTTETVAAETPGRTIPMIPIPEPKTAVSHGVNGHHPTTSKEN